MFSQERPAGSHPNISLGDDVAPPTYGESAGPNSAPLCIDKKENSSPGSTTEVSSTPVPESSRQESVSIEDALETLRNYDTVIIVDDSISMSGARWQEVSSPEFFPPSEHLYSLEFYLLASEKRNWTRD